MGPPCSYYSLAQGILDRHTPVLRQYFPRRLAGERDGLQDEVDLCVGGEPREVQSGEAWLQRI